MIRRLLDKAGQGDVLADNLRKKLERFYDFDIINNDELREQKVYNIGVLYDAIKLQRQVVIHGYASPHSRTTKDRLVEPFLLMNNNNEVRCYEPSSKLNKTFKVSRMQEVELLDTEWAYKDRHQQMYTDVFMFSGEKMMPVSMLLGQLSYNVFREEYPAAEANMTTCSDGRHRLDLPVCSYAGIGRFVLGLFDDIEVLGDEGFIAYLQQKVAAMASSYTHKKQ
ncbi:helix-turn-helix transcriptional regulator [Prevotella sp.]